MMDIKKLQAYFRRNKSGAFNLVDQQNTGRRLYFEGRSDYKNVLIELLIKTVATLKRLGVDVDVTIE